MSNISVKLRSMLQSVPTWSLPDARASYRIQLNTLNIAELSESTDITFRTKILLINHIMELCAGQDIAACHGPDCYLSICKLYQSLLGPVVYRCLVKCLTLLPAEDCVPLPIYQSCFVPSLKQALLSGMTDEMDIFAKSIAVKSCVVKGQPCYRVNNPARQGILQSFDLVSLICKVFQAEFQSLYSLSDENIIEIFLSENCQIFDCEQSVELATVIFAILKGRGYPDMMLKAIQSAYELFQSTTKQGLPPPGTLHDRKRIQRREARINRLAKEIHSLESLKDTWPEPVPEKVALQCFQSYRNSIQYQPLSYCASCGAEDRLRTGTYIHVDSLPPLDNLRVTNEHILAHTPLSRFKYIHKSLDGLLLEPRGIRSQDRECRDVELYFCQQCCGALTRNEMPRLALNNNLYRGKLPPHLQDVTWVEEMACALYRTTAHVARIYGSSSDTDPLQLRGNTCAHPMNLFANASTLPWSPTDLNDMISIIFVGPRKLRSEDRKKLTPYLVRKEKIVDLLGYLREHDRLYAAIPPPDQDVLDLYPENDLLPGLEERIIYDHETDPKQMFEEETSGFDQHPGDVLDSDDIFLETAGVYDPESDTVPGRNMTASALRKLALAANPDSSTAVHFTHEPITEYNNPDLFPGMFPTLFPLGIGGFEDSTRSPSVSLESHAKHLLDLADRRFRYHNFFIFVALNLIQRRKAHLHTSFSIKSSRFHTIAPALLSVHPQVLTNLANNIRDEFNPSLFTPEEKNALMLLKEVNTISSKVPGSQAAKVHARHQIRSYFSHIGLPTFFFTFNPSATHSPIFQVIFLNEDADLDMEHPQTVTPRSARARNVAKDPVAAADFFDFMRTCLFQDLFGWDFKNKKCKPKGGIFGKLRAHFGSAELTARGQFHGHYMLWMWGAHNPSEVHARMKECEEYRLRFFAFFEGIIHHHLPDVDTVIESTYEPRIEMPPCPPPQDIENVELQDSANLIWQLNFDLQHKKIGERHQRHRCRPVCFKGRKNQEQCRFGFPHEVINESHFEEETNSVIFRRKEPDVNGHNPYILVATRHNHDLKCILSGRAAKAAMFYISDYILKMPLRTEDLLSLLSRAVVSMSHDDVQDTPVGRAKRLLHRCLTHFGRGTQIQSQHAARLIQGLDDTMGSHQTVPMPSARLLFFVRHTYSISLVSSEPLLEEDIPVNLSLDKNGHIRECNQVHDYFYRPPELEDITFYDFIRHFTCESKAKKTTKHTSDTRLGVLARYSLVEGHIHSHSHELVRHTFVEQGDCGPELIPCVVGTRIPRKGSDDYKLFCLSHFKPFSARRPLISFSVDDSFDHYDFSPFSRSVMQNWEEVHECQDEREAERIRKQAQLMKTSTSMVDTIHSAEPFDDDLDFVETSTPGRAGKDIMFERECFQLKRDLILSKWLEPPTERMKSRLQTVASSAADIPRVTNQMKSLWQSEVKEQTEIVVRRRQMKSDPLIQVMVPNSTTQTDFHSCSGGTISTENTQETSTSTMGPYTVEDVKHKVLAEFQLNTKQSEAFHIITTSYINRHVFAKTGNNMKDALRLFLTGPGGTGKTHVVKAVKEVLRYFGLDHTIRFMAPTGGAANLIDGTTIHKGLGIAIKRDQHGFTKLIGCDNDHEVSFTISNATRSQLRSDWKDVDILLIDEISLVSLSLLGEIDAALRFAKENSDDFFGGLDMIFSGDQFQYPPTAGRALYTPLAPHATRTSDEGFNRFGRLAWNAMTDCISLDEQKRMESDPQYAAAVARLRIRQCTQSDVDLFNSRVVKSVEHPQGITMHSQDHYLASMIVKSNKTRQRVNHWKSKTVAEGVEGLNFTSCAAQDRIVYVQNDVIPKTLSGSVPPCNIQRQLLDLDMSSSHLHQALPGWVNLYVGMPVVLKARNINTDLGITNGARGYVKSFDISADDNGLQRCDACIVEFPDSKLNLQGLPDRCFPIVPTTWACTTVITIPNVGPTKVKITRTQLPIQPGFAVTGHSAQGQTLLVVLCDLKEGSWPAYVAASRAKSREGLFITRPVTLADLNSPGIPWDLWFETKRFEIMERNTRISWGFTAGDTEHVPNAEAMEGHSDVNIQYRYSFPEPQSKSNKKRQADVPGTSPNPKRVRVVS